MFTIDSLKAHLESQAKHARDLGDNTTADTMSTMASNVSQEMVDKFNMNASTDRPWYRRPGTWVKIGGGVVAVAGLGFLAYRLLSGDTEAAAETVSTVTEATGEAVEAAALR